MVSRRGSHLTITRKIRDVTYLHGEPALPSRQASIVLLYEQSPYSIYDPAKLAASPRWHGVLALEPGGAAYWQLSQMLPCDWTKSQ
jgi:hypothetical protein